jgi:3'-phosphoadenosine 5'-phosphosulfate sulfotransferase (PAPS reductase)/FAD synthetase
MTKQRYISFSGGVESTTMLILYGKGAKAIFCDTGSEHQELYDRLDLVENYIKNLHDGDFELVKVQPAARYKGETVNSLTDYIKKSFFMPSNRARYCTRLFKIEPIENYLKDKGKIEMLIGLNYDEKYRTGNLEALKNCSYRYPLIEAELDRDDCIDILNLHGLNPEFPVYMQRGGCKFCFFKKESEYKAMYYLDRNTFDWIKDFEESTQDKKQKFFSIMPNGKSMLQLQKECEETLFTESDIKDLYNTVKRTTYCGGFCHR